MDIRDPNVDRILGRSQMHPSPQLDMQALQQQALEMQERHKQEQQAYQEELNNKQLQHNKAALAADFLARVTDSDDAIKAARQVALTVVLSYLNS